MGYKGLLVFNYKGLSVQITCLSADCRLAPDGIQNDSRGFHAVCDGYRIATTGAAVGPAVGGEPQTVRGSVADAHAHLERCVGPPFEVKSCDLVRG